MSLSPGQRLGPYEIVEALGRGGMGAVYRARDSRLNRMVAVKVLAPELSSDPEALSRFEREARIIASLNHPNICTVYDTASEGGGAYLVMELVDGLTLAQHLRSKGVLSTSEAVSIATQVAEALDKAHRHGVAHRDLKPGNIMVAKSRIKVLDFGLAKIVHSNSTASVIAAAETAEALTGRGAVLGTLNYMAPEQLDGGDVDTRADLWAFGCVLFEMVTGRRAFDGGSAAKTIGAIVASPLPEVPQSVPVPIRHLIETCLTRDREERRQSAHDIVLQLKSIESHPVRNDFVERTVARRVAVIAAALAGAAMVGAIVMMLASRTSAPPSHASPVARFELEAKDLRPNAQAFAVSPDGSTVAYTAITREGSRLFLRRLGDTSDEAVPAALDARSLAWSPDGSRLAFFTGSQTRELRLLSVATGAVETIGNFFGQDVLGYGAWGPDQTFLVSGKTGPILRTSLSRFDPKPATMIDPEDHVIAHRWPRFLPGNRFVFIAVSKADGKRESYGLWVGDLANPQSRKYLFDVESQVEYVAPGYLVYVRSRKLLAQRFDAQTLSVIGEPMMLTPDSIMMNSNEGGAAFDASAEGTLVFRTYAGSTTVKWVNRDGSASQTLDQFDDRIGVELAPDDRTALFHNSVGSATGIWMRDLVRGGRTRFSSSTPRAISPCWSPDGGRVAWAEPRAEGRYDFVIGGLLNTIETLFTTTSPPYCSDWSRDGRYIAVMMEKAPNDAFDGFVVDLQGAKTPTPLLSGNYEEEFLRFAPNGKWVVFESEESSTDDIYVQHFPNADRRIPVSTEGGDYPRFSPDGREIFFSSGTNLMAVSVTYKDDQIALGNPRIVLPGEPFFDYDISADGQRLLVSFTPRKGLTVITNWMTLLAQHR